MPQTSVDFPEIAYPGQLQHPGYNIPAAAEGSGVVAGQPVLRGTNAESQCAGIVDGSTVSDATLMGWAVLDPYRPSDASPIIDDEDPVAVMRRGVLSVNVSVAVTAGQPVFVGNATATLGQLRGSTAANFTQVPGARFASSTTGAGIAHVEVSLA